MTDRHQDVSLSPYHITTKVISCLVPLLLIGGCANYRVSVNERTVYNPPTLLHDIPVADDALKTCIEQTITDQHIKKPEQLRELSCTNAGIKSLNGIEYFTAIQQLNLEQNHINDITPLSLLEQLSTLNLNNNQITNATPLRALSQLTQLILTHNPALICPSASALRTEVAREPNSETVPKSLQLPTACDNKNAAP